MSDLPSAAAAWSLVRLRASCGLGEVASSLDLERPAAGIAVVLPGSTEPAGLLGVEVDADCGCSDAWCRGADITAVYEAHAGRMRAMATWRASPPWLDVPKVPRIWCREVVVSAQTALPCTAPHVAVVADAAGRGVPLELTRGRLAVAPEDRPPHGFIVERPGVAAVLFLAHPDDPRDLACRADARRTRLSARLFPAQLEKGVLLRSRVVAAFGPPIDVQDPAGWPAAVAAAFAASPPPLTT